MLRLVVDPRHPDPDTIAKAAAVLADGRLVAFPTETVYGLGADALSAAAVARIYAAKGRPAYNPLIVHVLDVAQAREVVADWPVVADRLAERFWPGPLTLVLPKVPAIPDGVTAGLDTVAVRAPAHPVARALLRAVGRPLAAPSANRSMEVSPTRAEHVIASLGDAVDVVLDAGPTTVGIESTVIALRDGQARILRPGTIPRSAIAEIVPIVEDTDAAASGEAPRPSPGMLDRHYAPRAQVVVTDDAPGITDRLRREGRRVGILSLPLDPGLYARALYATLRAMDDEGLDVIVVPAVPLDERWEGVRDRLSRASREL